MTKPLIDAKPSPAPAVAPTPLPRTPALVRRGFAIAAAAGLIGCGPAAVPPQAPPVDQPIPPQAPPAEKPIPPQAPPVDQPIPPQAPPTDPAPH